MVVLDSGRVLRSGHTRDVFADPRSITAARLTGCKNILPCTRLDAHAVRLTGWDVPLQLALPVPEGSPPWASAPTTLCPATPEHRTPYR